MLLRCRNKSECNEGTVLTINLCKADVRVKHPSLNFTCVLPELDVFDSHCDQFVHQHGITLHHKYLLFMTPAGKTDTSMQQECRINMYRNEIIINK